MITAIFNPDSSMANAYGLWQWDYGQVLRIQGLHLPSMVEIHFSLQDTGGTSVMRVGITKDGVTDVVIPDSMLQNNGAASDYDIFAFVYLTDDTSGQTEYKIKLRVKSRPEPEVPGGGEDPDILHEAVQAVQKSADKAAESEKQAEGWAHGREDLPERAEDNAKYYAEKTAGDAVQTAEDRKKVKKLVESVSGIDQQVEKVEELTKQAQGAADKARESEQASKEAQKLAESDKTAAETAATKTAEDRTVVDNAKTEVLKAKESVSSDRIAVESAKKEIDQLKDDIPTAVQDGVQKVNDARNAALGEIDKAGTAHKTAVEAAGTRAVETITNTQTKAVGDVNTAKIKSIEAVETAKTEAVKTVQSEGTTQTGNVTQEGTKQVKTITDTGTQQTQAVTAEGQKQLTAVQAAAQEIVADQEQINTNKKDISDLKTSAYTDTFFRNFFAMQRTGKKYTVRFPLWETSQIATGEKLDDNTGLIMEASTITEKGRDDYETIPLFRTYDCNVEKIDGKLKITAMKGDIGFNPKEKDTFVLGMPYYHKAWEQDGYLYYSRSDTQHEGYVLCPEARKTDGMRNFCLYGKYIAGRNSQGTLGSYYGVNPTRNLPSYNNNITEAKKRGDEYCFGSSYDYAYIQTTFLLKYANKNWNNVLGGCFAYNYQYLVSVPESNAKRVVLKKTEADKFLIGSYVLVGDSGDASKAPDRSATVAYNLCDSAKILDIVEVDAENKALVLDIASNITTTATTWVSSIHWESGFSDDILGRDGCFCQTKSQISSMLYPSVIQGIELMVGGYEVPGNTFMDIVDGLTRDVYVCIDSTKLTTNVTTAKETYVKLAKQMTVERNNEWNYGTEIFIDTENGMNIITKAGASGSGTNTGFCDGIYFDAAETGQREFLLLGNLWAGGLSGMFYSLCYHWLGGARWHILARLSLNVFRGEFA